MPFYPARRLSHLGWLQLQEWRWAWPAMQAFRPAR
jgi:hypothetical protein